jgi:phage repressor protein C with HTH and peptisase S24 domain
MNVGVAEHFKAQLIAEKEKAGIGISAFEEKLGLKRSTINSIVSGRDARIPSIEKAEKIAEALGWELYIGPPRSIYPVIPTEEEAKDLIFLPEYSVEASAGPGAAISEELIVQDIGFRDEFLRELGVTADQCSLIRASGDSMTPTIPDGALLLLDHSQINVSTGGIFVLNVSDELLVKRISRRLDGLIDVISDNAQYPPETIGPDRMDDLRIVGRVVYYCRPP